MSSSTVSKLEALLGLDSAKAVIRGLARDDRGVHAILLYGAKGVGKTELANLLTEMWLCNSPTADGADSACRACAAFERGNNADLLTIAPQGNSSIIRLLSISNSNPKGDDPLPLISFFRTTPVFSRNKVAVIHDAHRMNNDASNALLKTLEEPHPHAKILLLTDTVGSILPTILSRCLAVACEAPSDEVLKTRFPTATSDEIRFAQGTPGRLQLVTEQRDVYSRLANFARNLLRRPAAEALVASEEFAAICDAIQSANELGARAANTSALESLAIFLAREPSAPPTWPQHIAEAHRRIVGNGGEGVVFDALFTALLTRR